MMIIIMSSQACVNVFLCQICAPDLLVSPENSRTLIFPKGKLKQTPILWPSCLSWELRNFLPKGKLQTNPDPITFLPLLRTQELWSSSQKEATNKPGLYGFVKCIMKSGKYSLFLSLFPHFFPPPPPRAFCFQTWDTPKRRSLPNDDRSFDLQNYHLRTFQTKIDLYTLDLPKIRWSISRPPKRD